MNLIYLICCSLLSIPILAYPNRNVSRSDIYKFNPYKRNSLVKIEFTTRPSLRSFQSFVANKSWIVENRCQPSPIWLSSFSLKDDYAGTTKEYCDRQISCREKTNVNNLGCAFSLEFRLAIPDDSTNPSDTFTLILIHSYLVKYSGISERPQLFDLRVPEPSPLLASNAPEIVKTLFSSNPAVMITTSNSFSFEVPWRLIFSMELVLVPIILRMLTTIIYSYYFS
jgi:hypothetical protein